MNVSYKWLKEYVDFDLTPQETADALTSCGLEVDALEEVQSIKGGLKGLYVGKVLTCEAHPNSDHLHVTTVDLGKGEPQQIVCGAPNVAAGQKVIVADLGCVLYDGDQSFTIKKSKLRGVESLGMICAEDEIGVGTSHDGIIVLPEDAPVGQPAAEYYHLESDWLIEIDITANRADALGHWGVARDLYAWLKQNGYETSLHRPSCDEFVVDNEDLPIDVEIENTEACKRYACVSITDCEVKESPKWLQDKLNIIGLRPINNIVDITNYIMMAYGQPLHCFDADMVTGHKIVVRTQPEGTKFITLDGEEHTLGEHDLSICNAEEPMCIAGIFGGKGSGTYETTKSVVLESAYFHPTWIRKSARRHGLSTDASYRFERGVDPNGQIYALKQAAILCKQLAGCKISMQIKDVYPEPMQDFPVRLNYEYAHRLIGKEIGAETIKNIATSLEMKIVKEDAEGIDLLVPAYRVDVQRPCDVVEDILRVYGYNNVELTEEVHSSLSYKGATDVKNDMQNLISEQLTACGFNEMMNNSLSAIGYYSDCATYPAENCVQLINPLSNDLCVMRQTLLFGALESLAHNINRKNGNLRMYEFGNCYRFDASAKREDKILAPFSESTKLGVAMSGNKVEGSWLDKTAALTPFDLKAVVMNIFSRLGISENEITIATTSNDVMSNALTFANRGGKAIGYMGIVAKSMLKKFDIDQPVYFAELDWDVLMKMIAKKKVTFADLPTSQPVKRDLALLLDNNITFADVKRVISAAERRLLRKVALFDVYEGKNLEAGKKSYAVSMILQDPEKTLQDKEIDKTMQKIITALQKELGAQLR